MELDQSFRHAPPLSARKSSRIVAVPAARLGRSGGGAKRGGGYEYSARSPPRIRSASSSPFTGASRLFAETVSSSSRRNDTKDLVHTPLPNASFVNSENVNPCLNSSFTESCIKRKQVHFETIHEESASLVSGHADGALEDIQRRVKMLEREKKELSLTIAPLREQLREKEAQWTVEKQEFVRRISTLERKNDRLHADEEKFSREIHALREDKIRLQSEIRKLTRETETKNDSFWDKSIATKRELERLERELETQKIEYEALSVERDHLQATLKTAAERDGKKLQEERAILDQTCADLRRAAEDAAQKLNEADARIHALSTECSATRAQLEATQDEVVLERSRASRAIDEINQRWESECDALRTQLSKQRRRMTMMGSRIAVAKDSEDSEGDDPRDHAISFKDARIKELETQLAQSEENRRMLQHTVQELKGNVRVMVRVRPFTPFDGEVADTERPILNVLQDGCSIEIREPKEQFFSFDKVFGPTANQVEVFNEVSSYVQSALDGYKVCLFSYGQSGAGKTHTMIGSGVGHMRGIIPRAIEKIIERVGELSCLGWRYQVTATFVEIYNEELRDLLETRIDESRGKLKIVKDGMGDTVVKGVTEIAVETTDSDRAVQQLQNSLARADRNKEVGSTGLNERSSRSHTIVSLTIAGELDGLRRRGALHLVDLAGSERIEKSGVSSDASRLKESVSVNKSLTFLGSVFTALSEKASHVPFRNSKLTYMLQDCLSGDGKTLVVVSLAPTKASAAETMCSLQFASNVKQVELGKPTKNETFTKKRSNYGQGQGNGPGTKRKRN